MQIRDYLQEDSYSESLRKFKKGQISKKSNIKKLKESQSKFDIQFILILIKEREVMNLIHELRRDEQFQKIQRADLFQGITKDEKIIEQDLVNFMKKYYPTGMINQGCQQLLIRIDQNHDGLITYQDFYNFMNDSENDQAITKNTSQIFDDISHINQIGNNSNLGSIYSQQEEISKFAPLRLVNHSIINQSNQKPQTQSHLNPYSPPLRLKVKDLNPQIQGTTQTNFKQKQASPTNSDQQFQIQINDFKIKNPKPDTRRKLFLDSNGKSKDLQEYDQLLSKQQEPLNKMQIDNFNRRAEIIENSLKVQSDYNKNAVSQSEYEEDQQQYLITKEQEEFQSSNQDDIEIPMNEKLFEALDYRESSQDSRVFFSQQHSISSQDFDFKILISEFTDYIKEVVQSEKDLDTYRISLLQQNDFDIVECFKFLDIYQQGILCYQTLKDFFSQTFKMILSERELSLLLNNYSKIKDGKGIRFSDLCEIFAPKNPPKHIKKLIKEKFDQIPGNQSFNQEIIRDIKILFQKLIQKEMDLEMIRYRINSIDYSSQNIDPFNQLSKMLNVNEKSGKIEQCKLVELLEDKKSINLSSKDLKIIYSKFDKDRKGHISMIDLKEELKTQTY
ncbi:ef hand family protein [Stylonychia lemnae]|uniref:Ef hand family protein n=1 Tax=Stylonychia lemnae TaxID=5949 RepID=A0A077ZTZ3_STYLE|nr:ef hand family protein [Stylonychia lemnae]|eukprot:CDW71921.1 ef hand family protein [Stylonychia lemnae]